jgi:hypothetical protein
VSTMRYKILDEVFAPIMDGPCWNASSGVGSFMTMEFGDPSIEISRTSKSDHVDKDTNKPLCRRRVYVQGQWRLWIYCCKWQCFLQGRKAGHSALKSTSKQPIQRAAAALDGQILTSVTVDPAQGTSQFRFDLGGVLNTEPYELDSIQWMFSRRSGMIFSYRSDGLYSYHAGNVPDSDEVWMRFS